VGKVYKEEISKAHMSLVKTFCIYIKNKTKSLITYRKCNWQKKKM